MANFLQHLFNKSSKTRNIVQLCTCTTGNVVLEFRQHARLTNIIHHLYRNNSYHRTQIMKPSIHTSAPHYNNIQTKNWNRRVTITQRSKVNHEKVLMFDVNVLDTHPDDVDQKRVTVVALHGMPGSSSDFESLAECLSQKGIRLIAPTSLGMTASPISVDELGDVDFTSEGRVRTLQLILAAINVHRIDMLLAHSAGAWALYDAGSKWTNIKSLLCVNPGGARHHRTLRPFLLIRFIAYALLWRAGRMIILPFMPYIYHRLGFKGITLENNGTHIVTAQQYISQSGLSNVPAKAELIRKRKLPIVFTYSLNDRLIESAIYSHMAYSVLGIPHENTVTYTDDKTPSKDPLFVPEGWLSRCLVFARGGHIVHVAHEKELVDQIENLLEHVAGHKRS